MPAIVRARSKPLNLALLTAFVWGVVEFIALARSRLGQHTRPER